MDKQHPAIGRQRGAEHHAAEQIETANHRFHSNHLAPGEREGPGWKIFEGRGFGAAARKNQKSGEEKIPHELKW
jgi:hypothetical protein